MAQRGSQCCPRSPARAWHCGLGQPEGRTLWSHAGGTGHAGKAQGPWVQGARGWGSTRLGDPTNPASPCTFTHSHTSTQPPWNSPGLGTQGTFSTAPRRGQRIWAGPGTHSNPEPKQPHSSGEAGADRAETGGRQGGHRVRSGEAGSQLRFILGSWRGVMLMKE